jgi:hypothetical protein
VIFEERFITVSGMEKIDSEKIKKTYSLSAVSFETHSKIVQ